MAHDAPVPSRDNSRFDTSPSLKPPPVPHPSTGPGGTVSERIQVGPDRPREPGPRPAAPVPAPRSGPSGVGTVLLSCLLALACGMAGAFGFLRYGNRVLPGVLPARTDIAANTARPASDETPGTASAPASPDIKGVESRVDDLAERVGQINERLRSIHDPAPELAAIQDRVAELAKASEETDSSSQRIKQLDDRVAELDRSLKALRNEMLVLQTTPNNRTSSAPPSGPETVRRASVRPRVEDVNLEGEAFGQGVALFKQGKYQEALELFRQMELTNPNDARVWYYAALSRGFATGKWDGRTAELVQTGIEHEKAGSPGASEIDATFRDLTPATGKDWLAAYRKYAHGR